jgi:plasmid replication initiation protein
VKKPDGERIVVWANAVAEARYTLSVQQQRLILWLAAQIEREDEALEERTVSILEMQEIVGGNNGRIYEQFESVCDRLLTRMLELRYDDKLERVKFNWMHEVMYKDGEGRITLRFHDRLKPLLLKLKERFSQIPLKVVFKLRGGYAIRWYEMLVAKKHLGSFSMDVEELRAWLGIGEGELSAVKDLRKRAIDVSKAELDNKADLTFRYEPIKAGRRITGWKFKVKENRPRPVQRQLRFALSQSRAQRKQRKPGLYAKRRLRS